MISSIISRLVILLFGTLYPAYASYKAVKTKNVKEYVKWMMYWIVFALFTSAETFTDVFLSWFPFYYEIKIITVIWLLSPATKGSSILYMKFVHPMLSSREQEIDEYISKAKEQSYKQVLDIGQKGVTALMQTAIKGGGGLVNHLRKSYSLSDLNDETDHSQEEADVVPARLLRRRSPHRSSATSSMYFSEIDVRSQQVTHVQSVDDLSSGYSSGEALSLGQSVKIQGRPGVSSTVGSLARSKSSRVTRSTTIPKKSSDGEVSDDDDSEIFDTNVIFPSDVKNQKVKRTKACSNESSSENEFYESSDKLHDVDNNSCSKILTACEGVEMTQHENGETLGEDEISRELKMAKERGGKYNKRAAPKPPSPIQPEGTVKGTLILKPGIIKSTSACKEIFLQSPKFRRRNKQYFASSKLAYGAPSTIDAPPKSKLKLQSCPSLVDKKQLLQCKSEVNSDVPSLLLLPGKDSKMASKKRLCVNLLRSKSFNLGGSK